MRHPLGIRFSRLLAIASFLLGISAAAQPANYENRIVSGIEFDPADQPLATDKTLALLPFHAGQPLRIVDVRAAIQNLYRTGRYSNIVVDASAEGEGVRLRFITVQNFFVSRVNVSGAPEPPNKGQLAKATKLQLGASFNENDLEQATENIMERLRANGLYNATVTPRSEREPPTGQINIDFTVDPGKRARFDGVILKGQLDRPEHDIIRSTRWQWMFGLLGWRKATESLVQSGVDNVRSYYQKHDRLLAKVGLDGIVYHEDTNTVTPTLEIEGGPVIKVRTSGARVSQGKLQQLIPVFQERALDKDLLVEGRRNLLEYFQSQGYFDTEVEFELLPVDKGVRVVEYTINRDARHKLVAITITGNRYFTTATLRERMYITTATFLQFRHGRYSERYLEKDVSAISDLYRSNGFRDVKITPAVEDDYEGRASQIAVTLKIDEGQQTFVGRLDITGIGAEDQKYLRSILHSTEGQPFSDLNVASDRDNVLNYYYNNGYPSATFDFTESEGSSPQEANLAFTVNPGRRIFVRNVLVGGLNRTNPSLVNSRIKVKPGDPLSQSSISESQRKLYDLGIFATVEAGVQNPDGDEDNKNVLFQLEEAGKYSLNAGFGAQIARIGNGASTTFDNAPGGTGFSPRLSLGVSRLNVWGLGHTISLQTRISTLQRRALLSYVAPQFVGNENLSLTFTALIDDSRDINTFAALREEGSVQLSQRLSRANTVQYRFTYRNVNIDANSLKISPALIPILSQSDRVGIFSMSFIQDRRDDPGDAHKGVYTTVDAGFAARQFGSETEFSRLLMRNSTYHRITRDVILARSTNFGYIQRFGGLSDIPLPERFFSGGATTNRAFPDNQAGPRDTTTGFPVGGKALLFNTTEVRFPLIGDNIGGVLFHDAGNVYDSISDISFRFHQRDYQDFNYMVHAVGFGIRYRTPIGPIRVDIALSPNSPHFSGFEGTRDQLLQCSAPGSITPCVAVPQRISGFQFHFSLGQAF